METKGLDQFRTNVGRCVVVVVPWVVASSRVGERIVGIVQLEAEGRTIVLTRSSFSFFNSSADRPESHDGGPAAAGGPRALAS